MARNWQEIRKNQPRQHRHQIDCGCMAPQVRVGHKRPPHEHKRVCGARPKGPQPKDNGCPRSDIGDRIQPAQLCGASLGHALRVEDRLRQGERAERADRGLRRRRIVCVPTLARVERCPHPVGLRYRALWWLHCHCLGLACPSLLMIMFGLGVLLAWFRCHCLGLACPW